MFMYADDLNEEEQKELDIKSMPTFWNKNSLPIVKYVLDFEEAHPPGPYLTLAKFRISEITRNEKNLPRYNQMKGCTKEEWLNGIVVKKNKMEGNHRFFGIHSSWKKIDPKLKLGRKNQTKFNIWFAIGNTTTGYKLVLYDKQIYDTGIPKVIRQ